jgi:hypothetical protein
LKVETISQKVSTFYKDLEVRSAPNSGSFFPFSSNQVTHLRARFFGFVLTPHHIVIPPQIGDDNADEHTKYKVKVDIRKFSKVLAGQALGFHSTLCAYKISSHSNLVSTIKY